ncbi:MAG TPA: hypothetical protein VGO00_17845 [Kofleriaceae bacterium]|jgi:hypothetical protein|nr:hypothetical protein [Kofleriaceae bacterium]
MKQLLLVAALAGTASANPRALPFTYTTDTLPQGGVEIEQFVDLIPLQAAFTEGQHDYLASQFQTEIEIGIADRLELGLYMTYVPTIASDQAQGTAIMPEGNGIKQRLRYIFAEPGAWPVDVGVYGELTENEREIELEGKILLQKRFDKLRVAANIWAEYELYFSHQRDIVLNPTLGATYEVTPSFHLGIDSFLRGEYPRNPPPAMRTFGLGPEYYIGPAVMTSFGKLWWSVGAYVRVTDTGHDLAPGEVYGPVWFRSMIGYNI